MDENISTQGIQYDYKSIMHNRRTQFSKGKLPAIVTLKYRGRLGSSPHPSSLGILHLNILYCGGTSVHTACS